MLITDNKELELQVLSDTSVCAIYEVIRYSLHLSANPQEAGSIEALGAGFSQTDHGKSVTLNAQANYGYTFKYYTNNTGRVLSYDPNYSFKVYSDDTIIAQFTPNTYKITVVSTTPKLGSVKGTKTAVYGSIVDVKAWTTAEGYEFAYWTNEDGDIISSDAELSVKVDRDKTVFAYFAQSNYELLLTVNGEMFQTVGGYALINGVHKYPLINDKFMSVHRINAYPHYGYYFAGWKENEKIISTDTQTDITLDRNRVIDAVFSPYSYQLTLFSNISEALLYGAGTYYYSANANIRVEAPKNYNFIAWLDENNDTISKSSTLALNIIENTSLKAIFEERKHSIVLLENIAGAAALLQGEGTYHYNLQTVLSTEANEGYKFLRWESKKSVLSPQASFSYRVISDDTITAVFERVQHNINAGVSIVEGGRVSFTSNTFNIGETVSISATENHHYHFLYWTENNEIVCREKVYEFVADKDINLVAHFEINRYRVNVVSNPENVATLKGTGVYNALTTVTVEAGKPVGYGFIAWINEFGDTLTHEHSFSFEVDDNTVLTAVYNSDFVTIDLVAKEGGRVMGGGIIPKGADTFIVAIPNAGYAFEHWTNDKNEIVSKQEEIHFVAEKDARYTAHFILADPLPAAKLIAYPNPIKTNFHIVSDKKGTIQIMDIKGAVLYSEPIDGFKVTFDCTMLAAGTYLYRFISDDGSKPVVGKFIKQ